jgi:predicted ArsR family transcriptional regulator
MNDDDYYKSIKEALTTIGFSSSEREMLIFLFELSDGASASLAATELEIPRQTAYSLLKKLADKGAVCINTIREKGNDSSVFFTNKEHLSKFIDDRCAQLQHTKRVFLYAETC